MRSTHLAILAAALALLCLALSGCGQKGPLVPAKSAAASTYTS